MTSTQRRRLDLWLRLGDFRQVAKEDDTNRDTVVATLRRISRHELAAEGLTCGDIAAVHGVSHQAVSLWARRAGVTMARRRRRLLAPEERPPDRLDERRRMLAAGATHAEVAAAQGVDEDTIRRWVARERRRAER